MSEARWWSCSNCGWAWPAAPAEPRPSTCPRCSVGVFSGPSPDIAPIGLEEAHGALSRFAAELRRREAKAWRRPRKPPGGVQLVCLDGVQTTGAFDARASRWRCARTGHILSGVLAWQPLPAWPDFREPLKPVGPHANVWRR